MGRKTEFVKVSEARILVFLTTAAPLIRNARRISEKLRIDYVYLTTLLEAMYEKGWIRTHVHNQITFFEVIDAAPIDEAKKRISQGQMKLK